MVPKLMSKNLKQFVDEETDRCNDLCRRVGQPIGMRRSIPSFVRRSLLLHRNLIEQWEGTLFFGEPVTTGDVDKVQKAAILSVRPSHFLYLGHYGETSCLNNTSGNAMYKQNLATKVPNSFVVLSYRGKENIEKPILYKPQGRAFGLASKNDGILVTNFYMLSHHVMRHAIVKACEAAFGEKDLKLHPAYDGAGRPELDLTKFPYRRLLYVNGDAQVLKQS